MIYLKRDVSSLLPSFACDLIRRVTNAAHFIVRWLYFTSSATPPPHNQGLLSVKKGNKIPASCHPTPNNLV
jgi:hypothetical protein